MSQEIDIVKMLNEEIKQSNKDFFLPQEDQNYNLERFKWIEILVDEVFSKVNGKLGAFTVYGGLLNLLDRLSIESLLAERLFNKLHTKLKREQIESKDEMLPKNEIVIEQLETYAVRYLIVKIEQELKGDDLPKKIKRIKKTLTELSSSDFFRRKALIELQAEIEKEIVLQKEEIDNRKNLENNAKNNFQNSQEINKHEDLNIETATLFIDYLFNYAEIKCDFTKKAEIIEFLTGFSKKQIVKLPSAFEKQKLEVEDNGEISEKFLKDMNTVRRYFLKIGLNEVIEKIDEDLGN